MPLNMTPLTQPVTVFNTYPPERKAAMKQITVKLFLPLLILFSAQIAPAAEPLSVFVSILPQKYIVQQIGKDKVNVSVMVLPGASPATYEPKPAQMAALSTSRLYFSVGVPFETFWLDKIAGSNPDMKIVRTDEGIRKIPMAAHHHHEDEADHGHHEADHHETGHHEDAGHHDHENHGHTGDDHDGKMLDPHIWTSPKQVLTMAQNILRALTEADPANQSVYVRNHGVFADELRQLDRELREMFAGSQGMKFMVFHPAWGYLAHEYGLEQIPIEIEGKDPKPAQLKELISHARAEKIRVIFVQPQFSDKSARLIAREIGGRVMKADPLAENWRDNIRAMAALFKEALK